MGISDRWIRSPLKAGWVLALCLLGLSVLAPAALAASPASPASLVSAGPAAASTRIGSASPSQQLELVLPLRADLAGLEQFATAVTTRGSPSYGQFEPIQLLERRFGASAADRSRVVAFLRRAGAGSVKIDATGLFADASMSVSLAQRLFGTSLARFRAAHASRFVAPTGAARIPVALGGAVTGVVGLDTRPLFGAPQTTATARFPRVFRTAGVASGYAERTGTPAGCASALAIHGFTPNQYLTAYDYAPLQAAGVTGRGERVALIEIDGFRYSDLRTFASCFGLGVPAINGYGVGLTKPLAPGGESTLDLEVLDAAAPGLKGIDVYESRARAADVLRSLTAPLQNNRSRPQVISASLGTCEPALLESIGVKGVNAAEGALALAAASGISILASSGDDGSSACLGRTGPLDLLAVSYPASSPFVTGVGGTNLTLSPTTNAIVSQPVWNDAPFYLGAGGGGVSGLFRRPSYQNGFVAPNRRIVPDVSMLADVAPGYDIYCTACLRKGNSNPWVPVGGTSAAAPLLAGGLALVDETLRLHQRQQLGVANSLLYSIDRAPGGASVFYDVTTGDNDLGSFIGPSPLGCCSAGPGFDYASGLGSVDLAKFAFLATLLQPKIASVGVYLPRQHPLAKHHILAKLSCTSSCVVGSHAVVAIGHARPFEVRAGTYLLRRRGYKTVELKFSSRDLRKLRGGLRAHKRIEATVFAVVTDSGGNVEGISRGHRLRILG